MAVLHIVNNPSAYGMDLPSPDNELTPELVTVSKQMELKTIAENLKVPREELEEMNAELRLDLTPDTPYSLKVPQGKGEVVLAKVEQIPAWCPPSIAYRVHHVRSGESVRSISARYRADPDDVIDLNNLRGNSRLKTGMKLKIPIRVASSGPKPNPASVKQATGQEKTIKYEVKQGDSLYQIANRYNTTVKDIQAHNGLKSTTLQLGQVLLIPSGSAESITPGKMKTYKVKEGDSPFLIAKRHQMNLAELLRINNLTTRSMIFPGQELLVTEN
jgi:membrane-bound lytic murein transglycosylase D